MKNPAPNFLVIFLLIFLPCFLHSQTNVCGSLTGKVRWSQSGSPYLVDCNVTIGSGDTLEIDAGVEVRFTTSSSRLTLTSTGVLLAQGTQQDSIYFRGDTTQMGYLDFGSANKSFLEFVSFKQLSGTVSLPYGVRVYSGEPFIQRCSFRNNTGDMTADPDELTNMDQLDLPALDIRSTFFSGSVYWPNLDDGTFYRLDRTLTVSTGDSLRIEPGNTIKFSALDAMINVTSTGVLLAQGTVQDSIFFEGENGQMGYLDLGSVNKSFLEFVSFKQLSGTASLPYGVRVYSGEPFIQRCSFRNNLGDITIDPDELTNMDQLDLPAVDIRTSSIFGSVYWPNLDGGTFYRLDQTLTINSSDSLRIEPGSIIKFSDLDAMIDVSSTGVLLAQGTVQDSIFFEGENGQMGYLNFGSVNKSFLEFVSFKRLSGTASQPYGVRVYSGEPSFQQCSFRNNVGDITIDPDELTNLDQLDLPAVDIRTGSISGLAHWPNLDDGTFYRLGQTLFVNTGDSLRIEPGNIIKFSAPDAMIDIRNNGIMLAQGTLQDSIFFEGEMVQGGGILVGGTSSSSLAYLSLKRMGSAASESPALEIQSPMDQLKGLRFSQNGIDLEISLSSLSIAEDLVCKEIYLNNGSAGASVRLQRWGRNFEKYLVSRSLDVAEGDTLSIDPGVEIEFRGSIEAKGSIFAEGTAEAPIIFKSGSSSSGNDLSITNRLSSDTSRSRLSHINIIDYQASNAIDIEGRKVDLDHVSIINPKNQGINITGDAIVTLSHCTIESANTGISHSGKRLDIIDGSLSNNKTAIRSTGEGLLIRASSIFDNTSYDIINNSPNYVDAIGNWLGIENYQKLSEAGENVNLESIYDFFDANTRGLVDLYPSSLDERGLYAVRPSTVSPLLPASTIEIIGYPINENASVLIEHNGKTYSPISTNFIDSFRMEGMFDWSLIETGLYDVKVINSTNDTLSLKRGLNVIDIDSVAFDEWIPFDARFGNSFVSRVSVPTGENLFVLLKKSDRIGYSSTWKGGISISQAFGDIYFETGKGVFSQTGGSDIDFHIQNPDSGSYFFEIDVQEKGSGLIKFTHQPPLLELGRWDKGEILRPYGYDWKTVEVPVGTDTLFLRTEGYGRWSKLFVYYEQLNGDELKIISNTGNGFKLDGYIVNPKAGTYYLRYYDSAVLTSNGNDPYSSQNQTRDYLIYAGISRSNSLQNLPLNITGLSSDTIGNGNVSIDIFGYGFSSSDTIFLRNQVGGEVGASFSNLSPSGNSWFTSFDITDARAGSWTLIVKNNQSGQESSIPIEVIDSVNTSITVKLVGSSQVRVGRWRPLIVEATNTGTVDTWFVPIVVEFSGVPDFQEDVEMLDLYSYNDKLRDSIDWTLFPDLNSWKDVEPIFTETDSLSGEKTTYVPIYFLRINPGETASFELNFKYKEQGNFEIKAYPLLPLMYLIEGELMFKNQDDFDCEILAKDLLLDATKDVLANVIKRTFNSDCILGVIRNFGIDIGTGIGKLGTSAALGADLTGEDYVGSGINDFLIPYLSNMTSIVTCAANSVPWLKFTSVAVGGLIDAYGKYRSYQELTEKCMDQPPQEPPSISGPLVGSTTPEDKYGLVGTEKEENLPLGLRQNFIQKPNRFDYRIDYWNKEDATAPAAEVFIRDTLDENFDLRTFNFTEIGFLRWRVKLEGGHYFNVDVDMRPDYNYIVNVEGTLDPNTREVYWVHRTLDPETYQLPDDPFAGYLPPIDSQGYFIGWTQFNVQAYDSLPSGTIFQNQAHVNFDGVGPWGPAPPYGPYTNTYDFEAPNSQIQSMGEYTVDTTFEVSWIGDDGAGCGIKVYDIYVSKDGGSSELWLYQTDQQSAFYTGEFGHTYCFYSIGKDKVGNVELYNLNKEVCTELTKEIPLPPIDEYALFQNSPNPFSKETTFEFQLPEEGEVKLIISDILGRTQVIIDEMMPIGIHKVSWSPDSEASSIYFYTLIAKDFKETRKMIYYTD